MMAARHLNENAIVLLLVASKDLPQIHAVKLRLKSLCYAIRLTESQYGRSLI